MRCQETELSECRRDSRPCLSRGHREVCGKNAKCAAELCLRNFKGFKRPQGQPHTLSAIALSDGVSQGQISGRQTHAHRCKQLTASPAGAGAQAAMA